MNHKEKTNIILTHIYGIQKNGADEPIFRTELRHRHREQTCRNSGKKGRVGRIGRVALTNMYTAAKSLQSCPTLCDPIEATHQAPPSLGFSRQEHWSGLPFPSPMHEREK